MVRSELGLTRRTLLSTAGVGIIGTFAVGRSVADPVTYNQHTVVEGNSLDLRIDWKEWYNGAPLESQNTPTSAEPTSQPLVSLGNVLPGDTGRLAFGLTTTADRDQGQGSPPPALLQARVRELPRSGGENGVTEPEAKAGDKTPNRGELGDLLDVLLWYDTGFALEGMPLYGGCDGAFDSTVDTELHRGPFPVVAVPSDSDAWMDLDAHPNRQTDCLGSEEGLCVGLSWKLSAEAGNRIQTDSVAFAVEFRAVQCQGQRNGGTSEGGDGIV